MAAAAPTEEANTAGFDEEDEFEEFEEPDWVTPAAGTADAKKWEEDWDDAGWDDEDQDDSFQKRLKEELDRMEAAKPAPTPPA
mmetsp:Transcript_82937/g.220041  ORF Transcript_82937/g.220041 Transcript_82937/m.220041 type:complete len:83 (+) Transcript_82937:96-344(+)|eukprot:CAMPEP_0171229082 /NCGR_PEP_ID=MMETSP0790-20130122/38697_1 /TAXON_ID=2925 /ORGANISM="Alexandrium catenella, Strain OF101" /LENGTH=82 /DNA_ID=CAMNT_0011695251 /DNA_START=84 /DNA_END=332 /DNA_ORIENTATION=+